MGILVRLVTSMVGAVGGIALALALAWGFVCLVSVTVLESFGDLSVGGAPLAGPLVLATTAIGGAIALMGGYIGAVRGYRGGLALGREICATNGPEQHSRIDVNLNNTRVS